MFAIITVIAAAWILFSFFFLVLVAMVSARMTHKQEERSTMTTRNDPESPGISAQGEYA